MENNQQNCNTTTEKKATFADIILSVWIAYLIACCIYIILGLTVFMYCKVNGACMEGTIKDGANLFCTRLFDVEDIDRYDVITFDCPDSRHKNELFIKRVIGMPGEVIEVKDGHVYADGVQLSEEYIKEDMWPFMGKGTYEVPKNCFFVLGDNRNNSYDSRFWDNKYVQYQNIKSKVLCILNWNFTPIKTKYL